MNRKRKAGAWIVYAIAFVLVVILAREIVVDVIAALGWKMPAALSAFFMALIVTVYAVLVVAMEHKMSDVCDISTAIGLVSIPLLSGVTINCVVRIYADSDSNAWVETVIAILCVSLSNVVAYILLMVTKRKRREELANALRISALTEQTQQIEAVKMQHIQNEKERHDRNKALSMLSMLLDSKDYTRAREFLSQYTDNTESVCVQGLYSDNAVLNFLLIKKFSQCQDKSIDYKCFIDGQIDGIRDIDLNALLMNILDNAIEAAEKTTNPWINVQIYGDADTLQINVDNTSADLEIVHNQNKSTTKLLPHHGYGVGNIRDVVKRYNGTIEYSEKLPGVVSCNVRLKK